VSDQIADYVACVRAQGARLGAEKGERISAEAGTLGVRAAAASEVRESLEKKYSVSDQATLEIVRVCGRRIGEATATAPETPAAPAKASAAPADGEFRLELANYHGSEIITLKDQTADSCARACQQHAECKVASFAPSGGRGYAKSCVLRSAVGARAPGEAGIRSWVKPGARPYDLEKVNYHGAELRVLRDQTDPQACARACDEQKDCLIASFSGADGYAGYQNTCVLRSGVGPRHPEESWVQSWVKPVSD
jgi:hypothetical protein